MNLLETPRGRRVLFTACYFVEGAPIGFLWWCLPALLRARGHPPATIGALLGWLTLPWALKWLWAPIIDTVQGPRWTLRGWVGAAQVGMALTLLPLLAAEDFLRSGWLVPCLVAHAVFAATQDAAIDAVLARAAPPAERGRLSGWMQLGMLTARGLLGGGALLLQARLGEQAVVGALLAVVVGGLALLPLYRAPAPEPGARGPRVVARGLAAALGRRVTWIGLGFAVLGGAGFEALGGLAGPLLTERAGGDTTVAGRFFLLPAVLCSALGGLAGGALTDRLGERRGALLAGVALAASILATAAAIELAPRDPDVLLPWLALVYLTIGWFTAASYALFLRWTDPRLGATQFSAFMGATNLCEVWAVALAGAWVGSIGYGRTFAALAVVGLVGLGLTRISETARSN